MSAKEQPCRPPPKRALSMSGSDRKEPKQIPSRDVSTAGNRPSKSLVERFRLLRAGAILVRRENAGLCPASLHIPSKSSKPGELHTIVSAAGATCQRPCGLISGHWIDPVSLGLGWRQRPGCLGFVRDSRGFSATIDESRNEWRQPRKLKSSLVCTAQLESKRLERYERAFEMAIAKPPMHTLLAKPEPPQHKRGRSLMFLAHHGGVDLTQAPTSSRQTKHKHHKHSQHSNHHKQQSEHHHKHHGHKPTSATPVYDECLQEAMKLKTRILIEHRERPTRFSLSVMKRVVIPPVTIPKKLAVRRGSRDLVSGKRVPFTKAMWQTQKRTYSQKHGLPVIHESLRW